MRTLPRALPRATAAALLGALASLAVLTGCEAGAPGDATGDIPSAPAPDTTTGDLDAKLDEDTEPIADPGAPTVLVLTPADGDVLLDGTPVELSGRISGGAPTALPTWRWQSDRQGLLGEGTLGAGGLATVSDLTLDPGTHKLTLTATDALDRSGQATLTVRVNRPPAGPLAVALTPESPTTADALDADLVVEATDPDGDQVTHTFSWSRDGDPVSLDTPTVPATLTARGQTWRVTVTTTDGNHPGPTATADVTIGNAPPIAAGVTVLPSAGDTTTAFTCTVDTLDDLDGDLATPEFAWALDGEPVPDANTSTLPADATTKGQAVTCTVTPSDGVDLGAPATSDPPALVVDAKATVGDVTLAPPAGDALTEFTCVVEGLADLDPGEDPTLGIAWLLDGSPLPGTTSPSVVPAALGAAKGQTLACRALPTTPDVGPGVSKDSEPLTLANALPSVGAVVVTPVQATELDALTCAASQAEDPDASDSVAFLYAWTVAGDPLPDVDSATLTGAHFDEGDVVSCTVTPFDGTDTGPPLTSKVNATIVNAAPTLTSASVTPLIGAKTEPFTCVPEGWTDPDPADTPTYTYAWSMNGETIPGALLPTLTPSELAPPLPSGALACTVTPGDGDATGAPVTSAPASITNQPPTLQGATLGPADATETSTLTCSPVGFVDPDGDVPSYTYVWIVAGAEVTGETDATLTGAHFDSGDAVLCSVTPSDGEIDGLPQVAGPLVVANTPPALDTAPVLTPGFASKHDVLTCAAPEPTDPDPADTVVLSYTWTVDESPVPDATGATFTPTGVADVATVTCTVTPFDGVDTGAPATSNPAYVTNQPPALDAAPTVSPPAATVLTPLTCLPPAASDPDGDPVTLTFTWLVAGLPVGDLTSETLPAGTATKGQEVRCRVTPSDGATDGPGLTSDPVVLGNAPPSGLALALAPASPDTGEAFACAVTASPSDPDGDEVTVSLAWSRDDGPAPPEATVSSTEPPLGAVATGVTETCETWACTGVATDSDGLTATPVVVQAVVGEGQALVLDGDGWAQIPSSPLLALDSGAATLEAWVLVTTPHDGVVMSKRDTSVGAATGLALEVTSGGAVVLRSQTAGSPAPAGATSAPGALPLGVWTHLAAVREASGGLTVFVDGAPVASSADDGGSIATDAPLRLGRNGPGDEAPRGFVGTLDAARLSVTAVYDAGAPFLPDPALPPLPSTAGRYAFDADTSEALDVADSSVAGLDGTRIGTASLGPGLCAPEVSNEPPTTPVVSVTPEAPEPGDTLTCGALTVDPDGTTPTVLFSWVRDGVLQASLTTDTVPGGLVGACESWTCRAKATDGLAMSDTGEDTVDVGPDPDDGVTADGDWVGNHGVSSDALGVVQISQWLSQEAIATRIDLPADAWPETVTHVRLVASTGQGYLLQIYDDVGGFPGSVVHSQSFTGTGTFQAIELTDSSALVPGEPFWIGYSGFSDLWGAFGDGGSPSGTVYGKTCLGFPGFGCLGAATWGPMSALGPPFSTFGDLVVDIGSPDGGDTIPATCD